MARFEINPRFRLGRWGPVQDAQLAGIRTEGFSWDDIEGVFASWRRTNLQVHYPTKLRSRAGIDGIECGHGSGSDHGSGLVE